MSCPALFTCQSESLASFLRAELASICCTSRQVRSGFASNIKAIIPLTNGVAEDVPPKSSVYPPPFSVVVIPFSPPFDGAATKMFAPSSEYQERLP